MTLRIYDYRMHEYVYSVHDQMFAWMIQAVTDQYKELFDSIVTEMVCLKGKLHVDNLFMTCMSAAFRVCLYLSRTGVVNESYEDFRHDSLNLKSHIFSMVDWALNNRGITDKKKTVLISPAMNKMVFEMSKENCYFLLVPYKGKSNEISFSHNESEKLKLLDESKAPRLRYNPTLNTFQETQV
jgi:hypothetical protein